MNAFNESRFCQNHGNASTKQASWKLCTLIKDNLLYFGNHFAGNLVEDVEIFGMKVVHGSKGNQVQGVNHDQPGDEFNVDVPLEQANPYEFDALLLPGGALNPDQLRVIDKALKFVRDFDEKDKSIAVICHGPWTLVSAGSDIQYICKQAHYPMG